MLFARLWLSFLLFWPVLGWANDDIDAVRLIAEVEDSPVAIRQRTSIHWDAPIESMDQLRKLAPWVISNLLSGYENAVSQQCEPLQKAMILAETRGLLQTVVILKIYLTAYHLCDIDPEKAYADILAITKPRQWFQLEALAGAELGLMMAEGGEERGFQLLENANLLARQHTLDPAINFMVRGYSAAILGLQNQFDKAMTIYDELLAIPALQQFRYLKSALHFNVGNGLMKFGGPDGFKKARYHFKQAQDMAATLGDDNTRALNEIVLSSIASREQRYAEAAALGKSAVAVFKVVGNTLWHGVALIRVTEALLGSGKFDEAKLYLDQAQAVFSPNDKRARIRVEDYYAKAYEGLGQLAEALEHRKKHFAAYVEFTEQMTEQEHAKQVASLELNISEARNRELQKTNELQAERLQNAQRLQQFLVALAGALVLISLLLILAVVQTRKANERKKKMRRILDHIDEGIVTIDSQLKIEAEYSHYLQIFLGEERELTGLDALEVLLQNTLLSAEEKSMVRETLRVSLGEEELAWELNEGTLPREVIYQGEPLRYAAMHWVPIYDRNKILQSVLLGIRDISAQRLLEAEVAHTKARSMDLQKELAEILDAGVRPVVPLIQRVRSFLDEMHDQQRMRERLPELHTIKGIARGLNLQLLSHGTHDLESVLKDSQGDPTAALQHYHEIIEGYEELLKMFHLERLANPIQRLEVLHDVLPNVLPALLGQLKQAGLKLGSLTVDDQVGQWDDEILAIMPDVLLHAFTNSADHGYILSKVARDPEFHLSARRGSGDCIEVSLVDQGAGLNRERVETIAREKNFQPRPDQEIWDVLLQDSVSTASQLTQTSGRGVGLSSIQVRLQTMQGRVRLRPGKLGRGTELTLEIPTKGPGGGICRASQ